MPSVKNAWRLMLLLVMAIPGLMNGLSQTDRPVAVGSIEGVILDESGKPISGATVYGFPEENVRKQVYAISDDAGKFRLQDFPVGGAYLHAFKESDGYPDGFYAFFKADTRPALKVQVKPGEVNTGITIQLGPKAAHLMVNITNQNGKPVEDDVNGSLVFRRDEQLGPLKMGLQSKESTILVPPVPFRFSVEIDGYETWHYGGTKWQGKEGLINLKSGETLSLTVRLRKK